MAALMKTEYVILVLAILLEYLQACPKPCICKWKNGKQAVECNNKNLASIPQGMDGGTQVLEFIDNKLQVLTNENFLKMDLINLQKLYLSRCKIFSIDNRTFKGLTNLVELDLAGNLLVSVPSEIFADCNQLMKLTLNFNPIKSLQKDAFNQLSYLNTLELNNCEVSYVDVNAFQGLHSLEWLYLEGNKLKTIRGSRTLPQRLKGIKLQNNPWNCDCNIVDLHKWLLDFNLPHSMTPTCTSPSRLLSQAIRSIPTPELACLPDVTPTTFYLEISEGKNVSLLCHVHASPEARVSWWFEGRVLQNDTLVAPGVHLTYFIEEGAEEKRSELFIYNTNSDDNGTFICTAENAAGTSQSNFTIRIIVKEEPIVINVPFPFEYLPVVIVVAVVLNIFIIITVVVSIVKCRRNKRRQQKREKTKEVALQYQQNTTKCSVLRENMEQFSDSLKENRNNVDHQQEMIYNPHSNEELLRAMSPIRVANHVRSPTSLSRYQLEQNPDLINDTESGGRRREGDGEAQNDNYAECVEDTQLNSTISQRFVPISRVRENREFYADTIHLNPNCLMDPEGFPVDYGLPKMYTRPIKYNDNFYRTLPYNKGNKKQSAANPLNRFSREAEFLSRSTQPAAYEHYCPGIRYTVDGYPAKSINANDNGVPAQPENFQEGELAPSSLPCCTAMGMQWPQCVPANLHSINSDVDSNKSKFLSVSKRCVGAQTENGERESEQAEHLTSNKTDSALDTQNDPLNEVLTESPDEGYEGEPSVV